MGIYQTKGVVLKLVAVTFPLPFLASTDISFSMETNPNVVFFWLGFIHFIACVFLSLRIQVTACGERSVACRPA